MITHAHLTRRFLTTLAGGVAALGMTLPAAASIPLDLSDGLNYDLWISDAEVAHANSYDPPGDWGMGNRTVSSVFGQHTTNTFAFQDQVGAGYTGLPTDGAISHGTWDFQLVTERDAEPEGGFVQAPEGETPRDHLSTMPNIIRAFAPHTGTSDPETAKVEFMLDAAQQGAYPAINLLLAGSNDEFTIYADYADGQEILWTGVAPSPTGSLNPGDHPSHADLEEAISTDRHFGLSGNRSALRTDSEFKMWTFAGNGLALDPNRTLEGLTIHLTPGSWNSREVNIYAASVIPEPGSLALLGLGSALMLWRRRR